MLARYSLLLVLVNALLVGCAMAGAKIAPHIYPQTFAGFDINDKTANANPALSGYQYQTIDGNTIDIRNCKQARAYNINKIAEFEYFRFQQLLASCLAIKRYTQASASNKSYFPAAFGKRFFTELPAITAPLLSKTDLAQRRGKTFMQYDKKEQVSMQDPQTAKILTQEDEIYITVLARGDFTDDGKEDLLVKSEWYARKASGKHVDLLILTKKSKESAIEVAWRMKALK